MAGSYGLYAQVDGVNLVTRGLAFGYDGGTATASTAFFITPTGLETFGLAAAAWDFWQWVNDVQTITWTLVN